MKSDKKKKLSSDGMSARDKMMKRKKDLESRGAKNGFIFPKDGTTRMRVKSPGEDSELGIEIIQFFLGGDFGSITSPMTFDEPCPYMEKYLELKDSDDEDDQALAKKLVPKRKFAIGGIGYKDEKGKEVDPDRIDKAFLVPRSVYQDIIDYYLDEDEWGDMTDPKEGYDIKIVRTGSGQFNTEYSVAPCQKKPIDKKYKGTIDLEKIVRAQIQEYDELEKSLRKFLKDAPSDDDDDDDKPSKKSKKSKSSSKSSKSSKTSSKKIDKKKKRSRDI